MGAPAKGFFSPGERRQIAGMSKAKIREIFAKFANDGRISIVECGSEDLTLEVNGHKLSVIDPLEGSPLVMADGPAEAAAFAERVNERLERLGGASFAGLLDLLASVSGKRPAPTPATAPTRRRITSSTHDLEEDETCAEDEEDAADAAAARDAADDDGQQEEQGDDDDDDDDDDDHDDDGEDGDADDVFDPDSLAAEVAVVASSQGHTGSAGATAVPPVRSGAAEAFSRLQESTQGRAVSLSKRMQSDLLEMMRSDSASRGIEVELADDDRLDSWRVRYTSFPEGSQLAADLATLAAALAGQNGAAPGGSSSSGGGSGSFSSSSSAPSVVPCVECLMTLPPDYPFSPPSFRVVRPRFKKQTGFVISGALCMELLTPQGWNATFSIEALLEQVRAHMVHGKGALDIPKELRAKDASGGAGGAAEGAADGGEGAAADAEEREGAAGAAASEAAAKADAKVARRGAKQAAKEAKSAEAAKGGEAVARADDTHCSSGQGVQSEAARAADQRRSIAAAEALLRTSYSSGEANKAFEYIVSFHDKNGWAPSAS